MSQCVGQQTVNIQRIPHTCTCIAFSYLVADWLLAAAHAGRQAIDLITRLYYDVAEQCQGVEVRGGGLPIADC
jgi:hypothetical protein